MPRRTLRAIVAPAGASARWSPLTGSDWHQPSPVTAGPCGPGPGDRIRFKFDGFRIPCRRERFQLQVHTKCRLDFDTFQAQNLAQIPVPCLGTAASFSKCNQRLQIKIKMNLNLAVFFIKFSCFEYPIDCFRFF